MRGASPAIDVQQEPAEDGRSLAFLDSGVCVWIAARCCSPPLLLSSALTEPLHIHESDKVEAYILRLSDFMESHAHGSSPVT